MTVAEVKSQIFEWLNSSKGVAYGTFDGNANYKDSAILAAIVDADYQVSVALAMTDGHPRRTVFEQTFSVSNGGPLPAWESLPESDSSYFGLMILTTSGDSVSATYAPSNKINVWTRNPAEFGGTDIIEGYVDVKDSLAYFSGVTLSGKYYKVATLGAAPTNLQTPDVFRPTVVKLASAFMLAKLGDYMDVASWAESLGRGDIQLIMTDKYFVPAPLMVQRSE
jgi:hypothetical protein